MKKQDTDAINEMPCNIDCPQYCTGTCPYDTDKKETECPRWEPIMQKNKYIFDTINKLNVYYKRYKPDGVSRIVVSYYAGTIIVSIETEDFDITIKWRIPNALNYIEGDENKTDFLYLALLQVFGKCLKMERK